MIPRLIEEKVKQALLTQDKIVLLFGARQVGKTTLLHALEKKKVDLGEKTLYLDCDVREEKEAVNTNSKAVLGQLLAGIQTLFLDEAQSLDDPGLTLKIIHDYFPKVKVLATGSSSFDLKNKVSEALTGRYLDFQMYPLSLSEMIGRDIDGRMEVLDQGKATAMLSNVLTYGFYPDVFQEGKPEKKQMLLAKLVESYLFKDILAFAGVRHPQVIGDLSRALAYQIGSEVNESELANRLRVDRKTIASYIEILEKSFVITRVFPFSKNPRREIGKNYKVYFTDLGVRNSLTSDFNSLEVRKDLGFIWENFLFIERRKMWANKGDKVDVNFWRSYGGAEVDYIEKRMGKEQAAFEFKYSLSKLSKGAGSFKDLYGVSVSLINKSNFTDFIF